MLKEFAVPFHPHDVRREGVLLPGSREPPQVQQGGQDPDEDSLSQNCGGQGVLQVGDAAVPSAKGEKTIVFSKGTMNAFPITNLNKAWFRSLSKY